jgi:hypothetical protein
MGRSALVAILLATVLAVAVSAGASQRPAPRPFAGIGLLVVRSVVPDEDAGPIPLYRKPGVDRIAEIPPARLPALDAVMVTPAGERRAVVMGVRDQWCRIIYDDADREGWLERPRSWQFLPWARFLKGRFVRFLPGLRKGVGVVRQEADDAAPELAAPARGSQFRVLRVDDDWAQVMVEYTRIGWLRWRDRDGRFVIAVE